MHYDFEISKFDLNNVLNNVFDLNLYTVHCQLVDKYSKYTYPIVVYILYNICITKLSQVIDNVSLKMIFDGFQNLSVLSGENRFGR